MARYPLLRSNAQEIIVTELRRLLELPLDDLLAITRRYLFVAIDRASRWVFLRIYNHQSETNSLDFLNHLRAACPDS
ncbi:MAG: hypothetical protein LBJ59_00520 [Zoogloeaceae bacterium]|nr:hypothetical protein [Zoogloeaceae bacterium]